ncbi:hypothetical protein NFI96_007285 [Prochilodus magdalenae]|nr:hypothetical protein NFI96_007285 [Prochilodus magdalenae]
MQISSSKSESKIWSQKKDGVPPPDSTGSMSLPNTTGIIITEFVIGGFDAVQRPLVVGVVMLILYILVMIANLANIYFIIMDKRLHQPMYLFICNLAVVDMIYCTSSCPTMIGILIAGYKTIPYVPCIIQMSVFQLSTTMEMFAISVMAFDRLVAVGNPLRYQSILTNFRCFLITVALWMGGLVILAPIPATVVPLPYCSPALKYIFCDFAAVIRATCVDPNPYFNSLSVLTTFIILGTFGFICLSYIKIIIVVVKMSSVSDKKKVFNTCVSHLIVIVCYYAPRLVLLALTRIGVVLTLEERNGLLLGISSNALILALDFTISTSVPVLQDDHPNPQFLCHSAGYGTHRLLKRISLDKWGWSPFPRAELRDRSRFNQRSTGIMSLPNTTAIIITEFVIGGFDTLERPLVIGVVVLMLYILIMIANFANVYFIIMDKRLHQPMYLFICNLAVVDMIYCTSACPTMIGILIAGYKTIPYVPCIIQMSVFQLSTTMEMFAISVMAFDRLVAVGSPLRYQSILTNFRCFLITVALWMGGLVILAPVPATVVPLPYCSPALKYIFCDYAAVIRATCVDPAPYFNSLSVLSTVVILGTFGFICLSYLNIVVVVIKMSSVSDKKKVFNTCVSHLIVIVCYYAPRLVLLARARIGVVLTLEERNGLMIGSVIGPSLVNPFIYCLRTKEIRNKLFRIVSKLEHPHTVPADGAVGVEVEGHQVFWTCDDRPFISVLTTVPPHTDSLGVSTKTEAGLVTEDDPLPF